MALLFSSQKRVRAIFCIFILLFSHSVDARADRIGGSNLLGSSPSLKGRITEGEGATFVAAVSTALGSTSNAGPTLLEEPSTFVDRGIGFAQVGMTDLGRIDFNVSLADRRYLSFSEADELTGQASLSLTRDWAGQQTLVSFATSHSEDFEEELTQSSISVTHAWTRGRSNPYLQGEIALLDYHDLPGVFLPFANQDDRDRISSRVQGGLRLSLREGISVEAGAGIDTKTYIERRDDFGVRRDSVSVYPLVGIGYANDRVSLNAVYMPFRRFYREALFEDAWVHGYAAEAQIKLTEALKAFASARHGFEETDFLIAKTAYERVVVAGLTLTGERGTLSLAASETRRDYEGLELLGVGRLDRKREVALSGEVPLFENVSLNGRVSYMDFHSSLGRISTDVLTVSAGLTYAVTQ